MFYFLKKKLESNDKFSNTKQPGRPQKTTETDDHRILLLVKKDLFTTSSLVKNTLSVVLLLVQSEHGHC